MRRENFIRLLWMPVGTVLLCIAIGFARTLHELAFPSYSGFAFYQPLRAIPFHVVVSLVGLGVGQFVAWATNLAAIPSLRGNLLAGASYSAATLVALLAERRLPYWLGSPGSPSMLLVLLLLALVLCVTARLLFSLWATRRHA